MDKEQAIEIFRENPSDFVRKIIRAEPDPWQKDVLQSLSEGRSVAVKACHGPGKSACASWAIMWFLTTHPNARVPCTAPTMYQLQDILWSEIAKWKNRSPMIDQLFEKTNTKLRARGREDTWFAVARSSNKPDNLAGFHSDDLMYVVDEAFAVPDDVMEVVEGALTNEGARLLLIGNPTSRSSYAGRVFNEPEKFPEFERFSISHDDSPRVSDEFVERMARKYGRKSDVYRVRVLGEFPTGESSALISFETAEQATQLDLEANPGNTHIGVDVAHSGDNYTAIAVRQGQVITEVRPYSQQTTLATSGRVVNKVEELLRQGDVDHVTVKVDEGGVGLGVVDQLRKSFEEEFTTEEVTLVPVNFGGGVDSEDKKDRLLNKGAEMWMNLKEALEMGELQIPADDSLPEDFSLVGEISTRRFDMTASGKMKMEAKKDMDEKSPDLADAVCLAFEDGSGTYDEPDWVAPMGGLERVNPYKKVS